MRSSLIRSSVALGAILGMAMPMFASSSDRTQDASRARNAAKIFRSIMNTPDKAIPDEILEHAQCIAIIPGEKKFALGLGGQYGKGLVTCRRGAGWSAPAFIQVGGASWGLQLGGQSTDIVMVFQNQSGVQHMLSNKFKIGADASAAAGPVGRHAAAATDISMHSKILTYSRSRGAFAGVSLAGDVVQPDDTGNRAMYGTSDVNHILASHAVPPAARPLIAELSRFRVNSAAEEHDVKPVKTRKYHHKKSTAKSDQY